MYGYYCWFIHSHFWAPSDRSAIESQIRTLDQQQVKEEHKELFWKHFEMQPKIPKFFWQRLEICLDKILLNTSNQRRAPLQALPGPHQRNRWGQETCLATKELRWVESTRCHEMSTSQQVIWLWLDPNLTPGEMWWKWRTSKVWSTVVGR